jgi:hypothetical protein
VIWGDETAILFFRLVCFAKKKVFEFLGFWVFVARLRRGVEKHVFWFGEFGCMMDFLLIGVFRWIKAWKSFLPNSTLLYSDHFRGPWSL